MKIRWQSLFAGVFLILLISLGIGNMQTASISGNVVQNLQEKNNTRVVIKIKDDTLIRNSDKIKDDLKKSLKNKTRHDFDDRISAEISENDLKELESISGVESVEIVNTKSIFLQESTALVNSTLVNDVQISGTNLTGKYETVCVLDTGVNFSNSDLSGKNETCVIDCTSGSCVENCSVSDFHGHGTHCAGIIGANGNLKGVAPEAGLIGVKVCVDQDGATCYDDDIRAGIDWCVNNKDTYNISSISISLGGGLYSNYCDNVDDPEDLTGAINTAVGNNVSVIIASGNDGSSSEISSPACIQNATSVADVYDANVGGVAWSLPCTDSTTSADKIVCHANRNNLLDLLAPGALINSTWKQGYYETGGTSMAAPHVAGAFALINQYKRLESNKILKPSEIQTALNQTGKTISDSESGLDFQRIKTYSSILYLDEQSPEVNLISPSHNSHNETGNMTFECNASDSLQLKNLTFKIWNSSGNLINETSQDATNNSLELSKTLNLSQDNYEWNCFAYDNKGNIGNEASNYTLTIGGLSLTLSPQNNSYTNTNNTNFTCQSSSTKQLANSTFSLWNSSGLIYNKTKNISGNSNNTLFNYALDANGNYLWNCLVHDSESNTSSGNYTLAYDSVYPNITLKSPEDNYSDTGSKTINFEFNVTETNLDNCSLIINNEIQLTNSSVNTSITNIFTKSLSSGDYNWSINCTDLAGNLNNSDSRLITLEQTTINQGTINNNPGGGSPGGSSSDSTETTQETEEELEFIKESQVKSGTTKKMKSGEKISFSLKENNHTISLNKIINTSAEISIYSQVFNFILNENESKKIDFEDDKFYDLEVKLLSVNESDANINLKEINEEVPSKKLIGNESHEKNEPQNNTKDNKPKYNLFNKFWFYGLILLVLGIIYFIYKKRKPSQNEDK